MPSREALRGLRCLSKGVVVLYAFLFMLFVGRVGPQDQDQFMVFHQLQYWNSSLFGLAKQWTPLLCGGLSLAGEPQVPFMSLSMALAYLLGPFWALKIATVIYFAEGWVGAYLYAGLWVSQREQRSLAAALFIGNGFFVCRLGYGHLDFIPFLILPLVLWTLHRAPKWIADSTAPRGALKGAAMVLLLGATFAMAIDGSPVAIIHLLFWIGLYALVLSVTSRSIGPVALVLLAVVLASVLDAGYLWPMIESQTIFPRRTPDSFTSFLSLIWFALIPMRGKVLPANGNGHELSVFVGPVLLWLIWRYRAWIRAELPDTLKKPLLVVAIASIVLGMGSLASLHVPRWLSPFDILRPLPGFRSIGVTGRYWGFLALPLSLLGAAALWRFCELCRDPKQIRRTLLLAMALQFGFQLQTIAAQWGPSIPYRSTAPGSAFGTGPEDVKFVKRGEHLQGEFITPTQGVVDCYDLDDFTRADIEPGGRLLRSIRVDSRVRPVPQGFRARFVTWSRIHIEPPHDEIADGHSIQLVLHQAYNPNWHANGCDVSRTERGNLVLACPAARLAKGPIDLQFDDTLSDAAAVVSRRAWLFWLSSFAFVALLFGLQLSVRNRAYNAS